MLAITGNKGNRTDWGVQIDDEAYARFGVLSVPAIVLTNEEEYNPNNQAIDLFDKMVGNVGIRYALEEFSRSGELREQAAEYLND